MVNTKLSPQDLIDFPEQAAIFAPASEAETERLRNSMGQTGQRDPIVVLPPDNKAGIPGDTILDGHRRRDAALSLEWSTVDVVIRHDLADVDYQEVADAFLDFNSNRRQLDPLDQAVVLVRRHEIETGRTVDRWKGDDLNTVADQLEPFLDGKGNKTARRNVKLACLPTPIIEAYRSGRLKLTTAEKLFTLKPYFRSQIADAVAEATNQDPDGKVTELVLDAVHELVPRREPSEDKLTKHLTAICQAGEAFIDDYDDRVEKITHHSWGENYHDRIAAVHDFLGRLRKQLGKVTNSPEPYTKLTDPFKEQDQDD